MMRYISTRGAGPPRSFGDVLLSGMAPDGGLYIPGVWPSLDGPPATDYAAEACRVMRAFAGDLLPESDMKALIQNTYNTGQFGHADIAPLVQIGSNLWLMELFHGPTLSFKDYALQLVGRLFDRVLADKGARATIVGATSGDTGSAAIEACKHCKNIDIFILHPQGRTSAVQRRQMTTVEAPNVFNIALEGTFDDCQAMVKTLFADDGFRRDLNLSAVNSINWARIAGQIVYYRVAAAALHASPSRPLSFAVPTGNFGNIYAGWAAKHTGLPVGRLCIGSNRNDILTRFFETGEMTREDVHPSLSPSMDIQVSSNFERYLCEALGRDHGVLRSLMDEFRSTGSFRVSENVHQKVRADFTATRCDDEQTLNVMRICFEETGIIVDPHTAVGLQAAKMALRADSDMRVVALACAHPAKFPAVVERAIGRPAPVPPRLEAIMGKPEHFSVLPNDAGDVARYIRARAKKAVAA